MESTTTQRKTILKLCNFDEKIKEVAVLQFTNSQTKSLRALSFQEANSLIKELGGEPEPLNHWAKFQPKNNRHLKILSLCIQLGWRLPHDKYQWIADLEHLSNWLKSNRCPVNKPLLDMKHHEVSKIISALEHMVLSKWK